MNYGAQQTSFNKTYNVVLNSHKSNLLRKYKINKMHDFVPIQINNAFDYKKYCSLYGVSGSNLSSHFFEKNNIFFILWGVTSKNISIEFIDLFAHHNVLYYQLKVVNKKGDLTCDISQNYLFEISLPNDIKLPTLFKEAIFQMGV